MEKFKLERTIQCELCPWKTTTDPWDIPNNYCPERHELLESTIATNLYNPIEQLADSDKKPLAVMVCHKSERDYCVGWLNNQIGEGNNLRLRIKMLDCTNINEIKVVGEQHPDFKSTLPKQ